VSVWSALFALFLVAAVPVLSMRSGEAADRAGLSRSALYANAAASLWVLAAIGFLVVKLDGDTLRDVYLTTGAPPLTAAAFAGWVAGLTLAGLAVFVLSNRVPPLFGLSTADARLERFMPRGRAEAMWVGLVLSPSAGICEEFLYRGFLVSRLDGLLESLPWAVLVSSILFGFAHAYQGWIGAVRAGLIGLVLALPLLSTGSLLASMAAHALIDVLGMLVLWPILTAPRGRSY